MKSRVNSDCGEHSLETCEVTDCGEKSQGGRQMAVSPRKKLGAISINEGILTG